MLFMGMLTGWYPAERDNLHIIRVRAKPRVSDCNVVSVKPCAGCPVGQKTHFPGFWGGGCVVIFHGATTHSTGLMLSEAQSAQTVVAATAASCTFAVALLPPDTPCRWRFVEADTSGFIFTG